ncbi:hypothetical protein AB1E18_014806 [Capra hircus]
MGKCRGLRTARKLRSHRRDQKRHDKQYKKAHLGTALKANPFGGASHAKGIVLEKQLYLLGGSATKTQCSQKEKKERIRCIGLSWWLSGEESVCQCRKREFSPWSRKIPNASERLSPCTTAAEPLCPGTCALRQEKCLQ